MASTAKTRLDLLLVGRGLVASRERARALILAGRVLVQEQKIDKPGTNVCQDAAIRLLGEDLPYVSRGGLKLAAALDHWKIDVAGRACLDVGASTGGFTDCLLQRGAAHVTAVDTGFGQIAMKLRNDPRVRLMERTNARFLQPESLLQDQEKTLLVMDVSFISATLLLAPVFAAAASLTEAIILVKPQFEPAANMWAKAASSAIRTPTSWPLPKSPSACARWDGASPKRYLRRLPAQRATGSFCFTQDNPMNKSAYSRLDFTPLSSDNEKTGR